MRVLQLIDSLRPGGAEQMAVSYANALAKRIDASFLCCTRLEGLLKKRISPQVGYLFLEKKRAFDLQAFLELRKFVKENKVDIIQAHSSSWFLALQVKLSLPNTNVVWHDHYGKELEKRKSGFLKPASRFFDGIISVNADLKQWSEKNLHAKKVEFFRNFLPDAPKNTYSVHPSPLRGRKGNFHILCLANLRPQKDHLNLLRAFELVVKKHTQISLHLVGKDEHDVYSRELKAFVKQKELWEEVFFYGEQEHVANFLKNSDLGVLSSASEGLPVAVLEYGRAGLPVVCTRVGQCEEVIGGNGRLVSPNDHLALAAAIDSYIKDRLHLKEDAHAFQFMVNANYSEKAIIPLVLQFFQEVSVKP